MKIKSKKIRDSCETYSFKSNKTSSTFEDSRGIFGTGTGSVFKDRIEGYGIGESCGKGDSRMRGGEHFDEE